jgi:hypothetical protein
MQQPAALQLAGEVSRALESRGIQSLLIGAIALAAHGYVRGTADVDLAIAIAPQRLAEVADHLLAQLKSVDVDVSMPDGADPLGGVINVSRGEGELVQVINFDNSPGGGFPALVHESKASSFSFGADLTGRLVSAEDLVLFKLYAGGSKSAADILELLARCQVDLTDLRERAKKYRLDRRLERILNPPPEE